MKYKFSIFFLTAFLFACSAPGGLKPSVATSPPGYLKSFPLQTISKDELIMKIGPPHRTIEINKNEAFVYQIGEGSGERTYTYIFNNNLVENIIYNDNGPFNGASAKGYQAKKE